MTDTNTPRRINAGTFLEGNQVYEQFSSTLWCRTSRQESHGGFRMFHEAWRGGPRFTNLERPGLLNHQFHCFIVNSMSVYLFSRIGWFPLPQVDVTLYINRKNYIHQSIPLMDIVLEPTPWGQEKRLSWSEAFEPTHLIRGTDEFEVVIGNGGEQRALEGVEAAVVLRGQLLRPLQ